MTNVDDAFRERVSIYMSYLLRHNPQGLRIDERGFVRMSRLAEKISKRFPVDESFIRELVEDADKKRFEIIDDRIRALYGHSFKVRSKPPEDKTISVLYHGTTHHSLPSILRQGLKPMARQWVHLSPTRKIAEDVGRRRTPQPAILLIDATSARRAGVRFYRATDKVFLCRKVPPAYLKVADLEALNSDF